MLIEVELPTRAELMRHGSILYDGWGKGPSRATCHRIYTWKGRRWTLTEKPGSKPQLQYSDCESAVNPKEEPNADALIASIRQEPLSLEAQAK